MPQQGTRELLIYSPFWLINKTGLHVEYRVRTRSQRLFGVFLIINALSF